MSVCLIWGLKPYLAEFRLNIHYSTQGFQRFVDFLLIDCMSKIWKNLMGNKDVGSSTLRHMTLVSYFL